MVRGEAREMVGAAAAIGLAAVLLCAPALWNGYPLVYYDTADYLEMGRAGPILPWRLLAYGWVAGLARRRHLWSVAAAQALFAAGSLYLVVRAFVAERIAAVFLGLTVALCALTALPWFESR